MEKKTIRYDLIGAHLAGVKEHPQIHVKNLGMNVYAFEGVPIADCVMMEVDNIPDKLPEYIEFSKHKILDD